MVVPRTGYVDRNIDILAVIDAYNSVVPRTGYMDKNDNAKSCKPANVCQAQKKRSTG